MSVDVPPEMIRICTAVGPPTNSPPALRTFLPPGQVATTPL
ncbi:MAG TPA: hypothetical protein VD859_09075 [Nocardioides sp.]|nr:hypothetical protein [Nocardioides sp.]